MASSQVNKRTREERSVQEPFGSSKDQRTNSVNETIEPTIDSLSQVSVPLDEIALRLCEVQNLYSQEGTKLHARRVIIESLKTPKHAYDLDIASFAMSDRIHRVNDQDAWIRKTTIADCPALIIRKSFLVRTIFKKGSDRCNGYPSVLLVDDIEFHIRHIRNVRNCRNPEIWADCCFGFPAAFVTSLNHLDLQILPGNSTSIGPKGVILFDNRTNQGVEIGNARHECCGWGLIQQMYGEVYYGQPLLRCSSAVAVSVAGWKQPLPVFTAVFDVAPVAVKAVRYSNDFLPGTAPVWCTEEYEVIPVPDRVHHPNNPPRTLTSKETAPYFAKLLYLESSMTDVEVVAFVQEEIRIASERYQQEKSRRRRATEGKQQGLQPEQKPLSMETDVDASLGEDPARLFKRFLGVKMAAISCENLLVATEYAPFGSLNQYMARAKSPCKKLSDRAAKHVMRHLLEALVFLHARGVAHRDISLPNTLLTIPVAAEESLWPLCADILSDENFERLEVVLFDFGQAVAHTPVLKENAMVAFDTAVASFTAMGLSCESGSVSPSPTDASSLAATTSETISPRTPAAASRAGDTVGGKGAFPGLGTLHSSSSGIFSPPPPLAPAAHSASSSSSSRYCLLSPSRAPVGKPSYCPPELPSSNVNHFQAYCGMCVDMWQLGIVGMCMLAGTIQVPTLSHALLFANNLHRKAKMGRIDEMTMECWTNEMFGETQMQTLGEMIHSTTALDFIAQLLRYDPAQRLTAEQALQHRWFQEE